MVLFEPGGLGEKLDYGFITWLYIKFPGMLRMLATADYIKKDTAALEKVMRVHFRGRLRADGP